MGSICSVQISIDNALSGCYNYTARNANYMCKLEKQIGSLSVAMEELKATRNDVKRRVEIAERQHMKMSDQVELWLSRVEVFETEVEELIMDNTLQKRNCRSRYKLGRSITKRLKEVKQLMKKGNFERVAESVTLTPGAERPCEPTVGLGSAFDNVWRCLGEEGIGIICLYGMGGVGKTTLLSQINNKLLNKPQEFDSVIWVVVSKDPNHHQTVQDVIGKKLCFCEEVWKNKSQDEKAIDIFRVLSKKKFVLLLDDVWRRVDHIKVGVPLPSKQKGSKIVFTTPSVDICSRMEADRKIKVECLSWKDAWDLFKKKVGDDTLNSHPEITKLAKVVAKECGGLPLALITIGRAMACKKTPQEWNYAVEVLRKFASEYSGMGDEVLPVLKFGYDSLPNETVRSCFLYCALFPEDFLICKNNLIGFWIAEGFLDEYDVLSRNQGYDIVHTLIHASSLEDEDNYVKMHDAIRDMALAIASVCKKLKGNFLAQASAGLIEAPEISKWEGASRIPLMLNQIENLTETPTCPNLITLFLNDNILKIITGDFFQFMPSLRVLDLSGNKEIRELPISTSNLVSLQYLDISFTGIRELQIELKALTNLKYLNMESNYELVTIPRHLISSFGKLCVLRMMNCGYPKGIGENNILSSDNELLIEELQCLKNLKELTVNITNPFDLQRLMDSEKLQSCTQVLSLRYFSSFWSVNFSDLKKMKHLNLLYIPTFLTVEEIMLHWEWKGRKIQAEANDLRDSEIIRERGFNSLSRVEITNCLQLKDLPWLILPPNLVSLTVSQCFKLEEIIRAEKVGEVVANVQPFAKLEVLALYTLPQLKGIAYNTLSFQHLQKINVFCCPMLRKLPLNANSANIHKLEIQGNEEWWNHLEWKDEDTRRAFIPCFRTSATNI